MKPHLRKIFKNAAILTSAFAVVICTTILLGFRSQTAMVVFGSLVMAVASLIAASVWSKASPDSDSGEDDC